MHDTQVAEIKRNVTPETPDFPLLVKKGSATVKIYEVKNRDRKNYTVSYLTAASGRVRQNFADLDTAKLEANNIALNLAHGDLQALKLTGAERQIYVEAERAIARTGIPLAFRPENGSGTPRSLQGERTRSRDIHAGRVARLLAHAEKRFLPWFVLIAFGGVRNEELKKGLTWESINFDRGHLLVSAHIANTSRERKIDLPENALEWLRPSGHATARFFIRFSQPVGANLQSGAGHLQTKRAATLVWRVSHGNR